MSLIDNARATAKRLDETARWYNAEEVEEPDIQGVLIDGCEAIDRLCADLEAVTRAGRGAVQLADKLQAELDARTEYAELLAEDLRVVAEEMRMRGFPTVAATITERLARHRASCFQEAPINGSIETASGQGSSSAHAGATPASHPLPSQGVEACPVCGHAECWPWMRLTTEQAALWAEHLSAHPRNQTRQSPSITEAMRVIFALSTSLRSACEGIAIHGEQPPQAWLDALAMAPHGDVHEIGRDPSDFNAGVEACAALMERHFGQRPLHAADLRALKLASPGVYRAPPKPDLAAMVNRFLSWKLPADFAPDAGITFVPPPHWPTGTNLFTAEQARAMLEHVLAGHTENTVLCADVLRALERDETVSPYWRACAREALAYVPPETGPTLSAGIEPIPKHAHKETGGNTCGHCGGRREEDCHQ